MRIHSVRIAFAGWPENLIPTSQTLVPTKMLTAYLDAVVATMNDVLLPTNRRVAADRRVELLPAGWQPVGGHEAPREDFDLRLVLKYDPSYTGHGWCSFDADGSGCSIMSTYSIDLQNMPERDREMAVSTHVHEFLHLCGCAIGEMYDFHRHKDVTGTEPTLHLDSSDPEDPFWKGHQDWLQDPMVTNAGRTLCALNREIVDGSWSMRRPPEIPTSVIVRCSGLTPEAYYKVELWRNNPDGPNARQEQMAGNAVTSYALSQGVKVSLLIGDEMWHTLTTLDLFLLKVRGPGVAFAAWFTVWDFLLSDEAVVQVDFQPAGPPVPAPAVQLCDPQTSVDAGGKPVFQFTATGLEPGREYEVEESLDGGRWEAASRFTADAHTMRFAFPHRHRQGAYRLRTAR